jgi:hypothetical protein
MDMSELLDFEVRLENLPGAKGLLLRSKLERQHLIGLGELFKRCARDLERGGVSLIFFANGQITVETQ